MFGFLKSKKQSSVYRHVNEARLRDLSTSLLSSTPIDTKRLVSQKDHYSRLDWQHLYQQLENLSDGELAALDTPEHYNYIQYRWLLTLQDELAGEYSLTESAHFLLLSNTDQKKANLIFRFLESCYPRILNILRGIAQPRQGEKLPVILFEDVDTYYQYISHYFKKDGEYQMSSGIFLTEGLGHFALPNAEISEIESVFAHELTHALVNHLAIPTWINEGLAVNTETEITGYSPYTLNQEKHFRHRDYWNQKTIQGFWSGESFSQPGDPSDLSYHLAQLLIRSLSKDFNQLAEFANAARYSDAGEAAAIAVYGCSLGSFIESIYGEGNWSPRKLT